jgi:hypothetical protein
MMMNKNVLVASFCFLLVAFVGCKKRETTQPTPRTAESSGAQFDTCALLTNQEIQAVMGSPIKETKSSANSGQGYRMSQCFYTAEEFSKSVSLAVTQADASSSPKRSAKDYWSATFGRFEGEEKEKEKEKESEADKEKKESLREQARERGEEEERIPPTKIDGIGEGAYWMGNRVGGALYVLKNDTFIRISVGGADTEDARIDKCKALAQKAVGRL